MNKHNTENHKHSKYGIGAVPTPERHRKMGGLRRGFVETDSASGIFVQRYRARWASPLDLYRDKKLINRAQHLAGLRFGRAYHHAVASEPACRERGSRIDSPETADASDCLTQALEYVEQAYAALSSDTVHVVIDVCAYARPVTNSEALGKLNKGLGRLALEWGLASTELCYRRKV